MRPRRAKAAAVILDEARLTAPLVWLELELELALEPDAAAPVAVEDPVADPVADPTFVGVAEEAG